MSWRTCLSLATASLVLIGGGAPVPAPAPHPKPALYFPTTVKTKWVYQEGDREYTEVITDVSKKGDAMLVTVSSEYKGKLTPRDVISVSERGLAVVATDAADLDEPCWVLKLPHVRGNRWDLKLAITGVGTWTGKVTARQSELVEVPAGKFNAICVATDIVFLGERRRFSRWYAVGVGVVKETSPKSKDRVLKQFIKGK